MFQQKGLFQADVTIHHALCATALQNYHASVHKLHDRRSPAFSGGAATELDDSVSEPRPGESELPGSEWGFGHMAERIAAAQKLCGDGLEADTEAPVVRLPNLQVCLALWLSLNTHLLHACTNTADPQILAAPREK